MKWLKLTGNWSILFEGYAYVHCRECKKDLHGEVTFRYAAEDEYYFYCKKDAKRKGFHPTLREQRIINRRIAPAVIVPTPSMLEI